MPPQQAAAVTDGGEHDLDKAQKPRLVGIFRRIADTYRAQNKLTPEQGKLLHDMERCRTAALGGHLYACDHCGSEVPLYNSCGNRSCPNCQMIEQARWIKARTARILPVGHHHVVFTLPRQLRTLSLRFPKQIYGLLLKTAGEVLLGLGLQRHKARLGATLVLHTWDRKLLPHPHVHCVVTGGGLSLDGRSWVDFSKFLFAVNHLKAAFRAVLLAGLNRLRDSGGMPLDKDAIADARAWKRLFISLPKVNKWVVYTEAPFDRSTHVLQYLGRYTHRIGLSDQRLVSVCENSVTFRTKDGLTETVTPMELLQRFLRHVLPKGLNKIRHVGLYAAANVRGPLAQARALLGDGDRTPQEAELPPTEAVAPETWDELVQELIGIDPLACVACGLGRLVLIASVMAPRSRAPPEAV